MFFNGKTFHCRVT